jgi:hypothetical protein
MGCTEITLMNGDTLTVRGSVDEVERKLSDAARSGQSRLAWFTEQATGSKIGVNPHHLAVLRDSKVSD